MWALCVAPVFLLQGEPRLYESQSLDAEVCQRVDAVEDDECAVP